MAQHKTEVIPFSNKGIVQRVDPGDLQEGQYYDLLNMTSAQEGALEVRGGTRKVSTDNITGTVYSIAKLRSNTDDLLNDRYFMAYKGTLGATSTIYQNRPSSVGSSGDLYTGSFTDIMQSGMYLATKPGERVSAAQYNAGESGRANIYFAGGNYNVRHGGGTGKVKAWGLLPPFKPVAATVTGTTGGPDATVAGAIPYNYVYTNRNPLSGHESNPCPIMVETAEVSPAGFVVTLTLTGSQKTNEYDEITGMGSLAVYRRGGTFTDGQFRLLGYADNPGAGSTVSFTDNVADIDIASARTCEFDNYAPTYSTLPVPLTGYLSGSVSAGDHYTTALTLTGVNSGVPILNPGTEVTIGFGTNRETCIIQSGSGANNAIKVWTQLAHAANDQVTCEAMAGVACKYTCQAYDSIFLAGNPDNPHILYKSKSGRPESFPVITEANGASNQMAVGSPSNPILSITELNGEVVSLNQNNIYRVVSWNGVMQPPNETPAQRGIVGSGAWAKGDGAIWYVAFDGAYVWAGGSSQKFSDAIDWIFRDRTVNGIAPIDRAKLGNICCEFFNNSFYMSYIATDGGCYQFIYDLEFKRWSRREVKVSGANAAITCMVVEKDKNTFLVGVDISGTSTTLYGAERFGTQGWLDGYTSDDGITVGNSIGYSAITGFWSFGDPALLKNFTDITLEYDLPENVNNTLSVDVYKDLDYATSVATFVVPHAGSGVKGRLRYSFQLGSGSGMEANSIAFKFSGVGNWGVGTSFEAIRLRSMAFTYFPMEQVTKGRLTDWTDLGHPYDKKLQTFTIDYAFTSASGSGSKSVDIVLDTLTGIDGNTQNGAVKKFTLTGIGRAQKTFPLVGSGADVALYIVKKVRLRAATLASDLMVYSWDFGKIPYPPDNIAFTDTKDAGSPYEKYFEQIALNVNTGGVAATVSIEVDGVVHATTYSVNTTEQTRSTVITLVPAIKGRRIRLLPVSGTGGKFQLWDWDCISSPADKGPVFHTDDWNDLGHPYDKRLQTVTFEYEVTSDTTMDMYVTSGIIGSTQSVSGPYTFPLTSGGRKFVTFPIAKTVPLAKMVRFQPSANNTSFRSWKYTFTKQDYPPDVIYHTESKDAGSPYEKYFEQLVLEVDTGGVEASVGVEIDGTINSTYAVTTTEAARGAVLTLFSAIKGRRVRLLIAPGTGGKFQLWRWDCIVSPADKGPVFHTDDWDNLGHPYDKKLSTVTFEYEVTANSIMNMYLLVGTTGDTQTTIGPIQFTLTAGGRKHETFPIPETWLGASTICKMVRFQPVLTNTSFKSWKYQFTKSDYPPDTILFTEWDDLDYKCEKICRSVTLDVNTGGSAATFYVEYSDQTGSIFQSETFSIDTGEKNRVKTFSFKEHLIGYKFRIVPTKGIGTGAKFQLFDKPIFERTLEPCPATYWDSLEIFGGMAGYRIFKQMWVQYRCNAPVTVKVYRDNNQLLYSKTLPAHTYRDVARFYLPISSSSNGIVVLNKSSRYRVTIESTISTSPFYLYRDASRMEVLNLSENQRSGYFQTVIFSQLPLPK